MKILHSLAVVHGHPTGKPACISIPDQLHFRKKVKHSLLLFNSRMRLRSCMSPADCRLLRPRCGRALGCRRALCVSCRLPLTPSALRQSSGLPTSPVCLLQTVGEPSVLSARSLRTYVPLRAKPRRKRVCRRHAGAWRSSPRSCRCPPPEARLQEIYRSLAKQPKALRNSCRLPLTSSALRQGPGLPTSPVCLLQTVGEPSVLSARSLRTYVPLRAKPKRKRVCKRYTGAWRSSPQATYFPTRIFLIHFPLRRRNTHHTALAI